MLFIFAFGVDENIIELHYYKNVELFCLNLINIVLKYSRCIGQSKRHHLVLKIVITVLDGRLLFIAFSDTYLMVDVSKIELGETLSPI